jgi:uncharacterized iron-regulated protein
MPSMRRMKPWHAVLAVAALAACATRPAQDGAFTVQALAAQMQRRPAVLLGEIHDNAAQHAVCVKALEQVLQSGLRPALAFEQFDRESQAQIDLVRSDAAHSERERLDRLVALGAHGWDWSLYRPFLKMALQYDLPIVAADLSRSDAMRVSQEGFGVLFDPATQRQLGLDRLPEDLLLAQVRAVDEGHCHQMPEKMLPSIARAQIARDATLARAIRPYLQRGVILLTGNGHARRDIGVPRFLDPSERDRVTSIGLLEDDAGADEAPAGAFDAVFRTPVQQRDNPCETLHMKAQMD